MNYDKSFPDGRVVTAPLFTSRVLDGVPIAFQIAEWLLVIVAFQYVDLRFGYFAAKVTWFALSAALGLYVGVLTSNVAWRFFADPFKNRWWRILMYVVLPATSGGLIFLLLKLVVQQMIAAQVGAA